MIVRQLSIFLEDKTGSLARITEILGRHGINMLAFCIADATDYGILRMIVSQPDLALSILRNHNYAVHTNDVLCFKLPNVAGALNRILNILSKNNIRIDYMYSYATEQDGMAITVMRTEDNERLKTILTDNRIAIVRQADVI